MLKVGFPPRLAATLPAFLEYAHVSLGLPVAADPGSPVAAPILGMFVREQSAPEVPCLQATLPDGACRP